MRILIRSCLSLLVAAGVFLSAHPAQAGTHDPDTRDGIRLYRDGGDVLRPDRRSADGYVWYIGLDAGLTYSSFSNGPMTYYTPNPINFRYTLPASVDEGSGLGFYAGLTLDFPLSDMFGIVLKGNYHTRMGSFDETTDLLEIHPDTETDLTTVLNNKTDWTFDYFGIDVLARIQFGSSPVYALIGPSWGKLLSNNAKLDQAIVQPDDIYYTEPVGDFDDVVNFIRNASVEAEVEGFESSRIDLKFGLGMWIELTDNLHLVPELTFALPLSQLVSDAYIGDRFPEDEAAIHPWYLSDATTPLVEQNKDWNMLTGFFTLGLRWTID